MQSMDHCELHWAVIWMISCCYILVSQDLRWGPRWRRHWQERSDADWFWLAHAVALIAYDLEIWMAPRSVVAITCITFHGTSCHGMCDGMNELDQYSGKQSKILPIQNVFCPGIEERQFVYLIQCAFLANTIHSIEHWMHPAVVDILNYWCREYTEHPMHSFEYSAQWRCIDGVWVIKHW